MNFMPKTDKLVAKLHDKDPKIKIMVLIELGKLRDTTAISSIYKTATDEDERVRTQTAICLGQIGSIDAGSILIQLSEDEDNAVKMEAANALGILGARGYSKSKDALELMLNDENFNVRKYAIAALGSSGDNQTIDKLVEIFKLKKSSLETKQQISSTVGKIGGSYAMEVLKSWIIEGSMEVRRDALNALGSIANEAAVDILIEIVKDKKEDKIIKNYAKAALKNIIKVAKDNYLNLKNSIEKLL